MSEKEAVAVMNPESKSGVITVKNYINGQWVDSLGTNTVDVINPATEEVIAKTPLGTTGDVDRAVKASLEAFKLWRETPVIDRVQVLFKLKTLLEEHAEEIAKICTQENGKTLAESRGDVRRGIQMVETACAMPTLMMGKKSEDIAKGIDSEAIRQPMGVFTAIAPFNFPPMVPMWFWPYAVAAGNAFILKPSERVPLSQIRMFELAEKAGMPKGVLNMVHGGKEVVDALCSHPDIQGVSFVGSTPIAKHVYTLATSHGKRVQALGGAKNFMVVLPDAPMDLTVRTIVESCTGCAGQRCLAGSVVVGVDKAYDEMEAGVVKLAQSMRAGNGLSVENGIGPVISEASRKRILDLITEAEKQGAKVIVDGRPAANEGVMPEKGYFIKPTVIAGVTPSMRIAQEEVFGPVICLSKAKNLDTAVEWINSSNYANTASLFTSSGAAARKFQYAADPAMLGINIGVPAPMAFFSFGGKKDSFFGDVKAHGSSSVDFYTDTKVTITRWVSESSIW